MKNTKLTLATAVSVLALTFTGSVFADGGDRQKRLKQENVIAKTTTKTKVIKKEVTRNNNRFANKKIAKKRVTTRQIAHKKANKKFKRVVVKHSPNKKVIVTKRVVKKPANARFVSNKRFNQSKKHNQRVTYKNTNKSNKSYKRGKSVKQFVYSVRPGDTLIQVSYKTGVSVKKLARLNRMNEKTMNNLKIGQKLFLA